MFVLNDDLAIKDCGAALEIGRSLNDTGITVAPIESVTGISATLPRSTTRSARYPSCLTS